MIQIYSKGKKITLGSKGIYHTTDFDCHCIRHECAWTHIDSDLIEALEDLSDITGTLQITSGHRCPEHNADIGGEPHSYHCLGMAADVVSHLFLPIEIRNAAEKILHFQNGGIGAYNKFSHLDTGPRRRWGPEKIC